eukprot:295490_1
MHRPSSILISLKQRVQIFSPTSCKMNRIAMFMFLILATSQLQLSFAKPGNGEVDMKEVQAEVDNLAEGVPGMKDAMQKELLQNGEGADVKADSGAAAQKLSVWVAIGVVAVLGYINY